MIERTKAAERAKILTTFLELDISDEIQKKIAKYIGSLEIEKREEAAKGIKKVLEKYDENEVMIYIEMLEKYPNCLQEQERVKFEIKVNNMKPSHLKYWEDMF